MKYLRILLLVLLAVLLPLRGAVAATMLCHNAAGPGTALVSAEHEHHEIGADHDTHTDHAAAHNHADGVASDDGSSSGEDSASCQFCANGCCMASMVGTVPALSHTVQLAAVIFPALIGPIPAFQSGGQDRPPRTI